MMRASGLAWQSGPSAKAEWLPIMPDRPGDRDLRALPAADDALEGDGYGAPHAALYVVAAPALAKVPASGAPVLGLTLVLSRPPDVGEALDSLVTGAVLALSLSVLPTTDELSRASAATEVVGTAVPVVVRRANWSLIDTTTDATFAAAEVEGNAGTVALSQTVTREVALSLLSTLIDDGDYGLLTRCQVTFRAFDVSTRQKSNSGDAEPTNAAQTTIIVTTHTTNIERRVDLERPLADILRHAADGRPLDAIVRAVCPGPDGTLLPIARQIADTETRSTARDAQSTGYASVGDSLAAMPAVLKTSMVTTKIGAHALAVSDIAVRPNALAQHWQMHDLVLHPATAAEQTQSLPVVEGDVPLWPDRVDGTRFWYAPDFAVVDPTPASVAPDAPFQFSFAVVGHDSQGRPGLEAKVRFTLRMGMSTATRAEWEARNRPRSDPVPTNGLSLALEVPFRDQNGATAAQMINATDIHFENGLVVATFALTDQWARLAYGAIGTQGFQTRPARLNVAYIFPAYVPVREKDTRVHWGGKSAALDKDAVPRPLLSATAVSLHQPASVSSTVLAHPAVVAHHPVLTQPLVLVRPKTYGIRTQGRTQGLDVFMPCGQFGALYIQEAEPQSGESSQAIGCRDAWTLGQIRLRLYEPLAIDVGTAGRGFSVFRSAQVPGRFLVLPKTYTIARFEPDDARAYRPAIYLYSSVDAVHPERTTCIMMASLRPAVTPADRCALIDALRTAAHPDPTLEWPTELPIEPRYTWAIPGSGGAGDISPAAAKTPEGFQVSLATGVDHILQLKAIVETSGLIASVVFPLADGTTLQSTLNLDLRRIDGPWESGAVALTVAGGRATIVNRVERAADIQDVLVYAGGTRLGTVGVERRLEPNASLDVDLPQGAEDAIAQYALVNTAATLEEIRTFIEDIYTNVVFVCVFDLAAENIVRVEIAGRIAGVASAASAVIDVNAASAEMPFVLPLTVYLSQPTLQYRPTFTGTDGSVSGGQWRDWRLDVRGNIVEIDKSELQEA